MAQILRHSTLLLILSCVANVFNATAGEPENPGQVQQGLSAGSSTVSSQQQHDLGLVGVRGKPPGTSAPTAADLPKCSGVLLANDWALTAGHCVDIDYGWNFWIKHPDTNGAYFGTDAVYKFGYHAGDLSGPDLALLHLTSPVPLNGRTTGFRNRFWTGSVLNRTVAAFGLGGAMTNYTAFDFIVSSVTGPSNRNLIITSIAKNKLPQGRVNIVEGDSGGPGFIWENGVPFLISINSVAGSNTVVSIPANHEAVTAVTKSQWFQNRSTNSIGIDRAEINANVWRLGPQLDQVLWALAQRSATDLCRRRNMAGGHYEGTQQGSTVSLQCSKKANVAYFDADPTNDAAVPSYWRFPNIDTVPWATANRAAERICASKGKGFAGGHFNGNQSGNAKGLFCFSNAQYVESKVENPNQHMNLDTVSWAAAARFAKGYCNREGAASGFPNGHQITKGTTQFKGLVCFR